MPSNAKKAFGRNIERAGYFLEIHKEAKIGPGAPTLPYRELPRAAVVFSVGALDAYLSDVSAETLLERLQTGPTLSQKRVLAKISQAVPSLSLEVALIQDQEERVSQVRVAVDSYFAGQSAHGAKAVADAVQLFDAKASAVWDAVTASGFPDPAKDLDDWTQKRHQIIHRGERPSVHRDEAQKCVDLIAAIVKASEEEIRRASRAARSE